MFEDSSPRWPRRVSVALLVLASPLFLLVGYMFLIQGPLDTVHGVAAVFSGKDVVQTAGSIETGITLALLVGLVWLLLRLVHIDIFRWVGMAVLLYGALLIFPVIFAAGLATTYGLERVLTRRGYSYCTLHVLSRDRGESGPSVYVRDDRPGACAQVKAMFPPHTIVAGNTGAFDLP